MATMKLFFLKPVIWFVFIGCFTLFSCSNTQNKSAKNEGLVNKFQNFSCGHLREKYKRLKYNVSAASSQSRNFDSNNVTHFLFSPIVSLPIFLQFPETKKLMHYRDELRDLENVPTEKNCSYLMSEIEKDRLKYIQKSETR